MNFVPQPSFIASPSSGPAPLTVSFDASASTDDREVVSYTWSFGDGETGSGALVSHTYYVPDSYTVTLIVLDDQNASKSLSHTVTVTAGVVPPANPIGGILFCIEQGGFDYCSRTDWGYSSQWLQNGATSNILLADARGQGTLEPIGAVDFDRIVIRFEVWTCYADAWAKLTADNLRLIINSTAQVVGQDDMEGAVLARWTKWEHSTAGGVRGGDMSAVASPDDHSQALQVYVPSGIDASCAGVWATRSFDMPSTVNTSDVTLRVSLFAEGQGYFHEGYIAIFLYKKQ
jgi:PKD repeat protein